MKKLISLRISKETQENIKEIKNLTKMKDNTDVIEESIKKYLEAIINKGYDLNNVKIDI